MRLWAILVSVSCVSSGPYSAFTGVWTGAPTATILGPFTPDQTITFTIREWNGGLLTTDVFNSDAKIPQINGSVQQFWFSGVDNSMLYCGDLRNFFSSNASAQVGSIAFPFVFMPNQSTPTSLFWCAAPNYPKDLNPDCSIITKQMSIQGDQLTLQVLLPGGQATHLQATLKRVGFVVGHPWPPPCNLSSATLISYSPVHGSSLKLARKSKLPGCPHLSSLLSSKLIAKKKVSSFDYCYQFNEANQVRVEHTINDAVISVSVSANVQPGGWLAIGFYPQQPAMMNADVVVGYLSSAGTGCVRSMYASAAFGVLDDSTLMPLSQQSVNFDGSSQRMTVAFTRNLNSGHTPIPAASDPVNPLYSQLMWAIGSGPLSDCSSRVSYHGFNRGFASIDWHHPYDIVPSYRSCS